MCKRWWHLAGYRHFSGIFTAHLLGVFFFFLNWHLASRSQPTTQGETYDMQTYLQAF